MEEIPAGLRRTREKWLRVVNAGDPDAYAELLSEEGLWLPPRQEPVLGRAAFREWLRPFFDRYEYDFSLQRTRIRVRGDSAVETGGFVSRMTPKQGGETMEHRGTYTLVWRCEEDGEWRIERYVDDTELRRELEEGG